MAQVTLRSTRDSGGSRYLGAELRENGDLVFEGQDLGPAVEDFFGCSEYEWIWKVEAAEVPKVAAALGGDPADLLELLAVQYSGDRASELQEFLDSNQIPYQRWSRTGD